jgi:hypothetical protein
VLACIEGTYVKEVEKGRNGRFSLVVDDSIFRFVGGGESEGPSDCLLRPAMVEVLEENSLTRRREDGREAIVCSSMEESLHLKWLYVAVRMEFTRCWIEGEGKGVN